MRTARKNKQTLFYSLQGSNLPVYETDDNGNVVFEEIDGVLTPIETGDSFTSYDAPVEFKGNISFYTGWSFPGVWGITLGNADAVLQMDKNEIPIDETSRLWFQSEPKTKTVNVYDETQHEMVQRVVTDADSADFLVSRVIPSLHYVRYVLKGIEK